MRVALLAMSLPAATAEAHAHWKLNPPSHPVTSTTSPMKYKSRTFVAFHILAGEFLRVDAASGYFGLFISLGAGGTKLPTMDAVF